MNKTTRILIVGDSWANTIRKGGVSGISEKNPFTKALFRHGLSHIDTVGERTVWAGMRADDFYKDDNKQLIFNELNTYKEISIAHIVVGGNDFLHEAVGKALLKKDNHEIYSFLNVICDRLENLIRLIKTANPEIYIMFSSYDFIDIMKAGQKIGFDTAHLTFETFNYWFEKLNSLIQSRLSEIPLCCFADNMGGFYRFTNVCTSLPLYQQPIVQSCYKPDGIHPNNLGNHIILDNCFSQLYSKILS